MIESWTGVRSERLHGGHIRCRQGFDLESWRHLGIELAGTQTLSATCTSALCGARAQIPRSSLGQVGRISLRPARSAATCSVRSNASLAARSAVGRPELATRPIGKPRSTGAANVLPSMLRGSSCDHAVSKPPENHRRDYESPEALDVVLRAFSEQPDTAFQIVVADNGSTSETAAVVDRWSNVFRDRVQHAWQANDG